MDICLVSGSKFSLNLSSIKSSETALAVSSTLAYLGTAVASVVFLALTEILRSDFSLHVLPFLRVLWVWRKAHKIKKKNEFIL